MKVIVLVILLSACVLCNAVGDESSLKSLENTNDGQIRTAREAFASSLKDEDKKKGKKNKRKIKKRNKKGKSSKKQKGKAKKGRKERKNKGKLQKSKGKNRKTKKGAKKKNKSAKKNKKRKSSKKGKSKNKVSKNKKNKKQERKGMKKNKGKRKLGSGRQNNSSSSSSSNDCPDLQCIINAAQAFKVEKDTVKNFFKQKNRIESQLKTIGNKLKKKGTFEEDGNALKTALGNNIENATCGSKKLAKNSSTIFSLKQLLNCSAIIKEGCASLEVNSTVTGSCADTLTEFKDESKKCVAKTGSEACSCWEKLTEYRSNISACKILTYSKEIKSALTTCKEAFSKCKKAQDAAVEYVSTCTQDSDKILENLKTLGDNEEATNQVLSKINDAISDNNSTSRQRRGTETITGTVFITRITSFVTKTSSNLYASSITSTSTKITQTVVSSLSSTELTSLTSLKTSINTVLTSFSSSKSALQAQYKTLTGSFASTEEIRVGAKTSGSTKVLTKLQIVTLAKAAVTSVQTKITDVLAGTASTSTSNKVTETYFKTVVKNFVSLVKTDYFSTSIREQSLEITSATVTISSESVKTSLKSVQTSITSLLTAMTEKLSILQKQVKTLTGTTANTFQIYSGSLIGTKNSVTEDNLKKMKALTENKNACSNAKKAMDAAVAGTATSGTIETTGTEFKSACTSLIETVTKLTISKKVVKMSLSITTAKVTLTATEKKEIETLSTSLATQIAIIEKDLVLIQEALKTSTGAEATDEQIASGKAKGTKDDAVQEKIEQLKTVKKNKMACMKAETKMTEAIEGKATTGTETTSTEFVTVVTAFVKLVTEDLLDVSIITKSTSITTVKVTLTTADITTITTQKTSLTSLISQMAAMEELLQASIKELVTTTANSVQITSGSKEATSETAKMETLMELKLLTLTSKSVTSVTSHITKATSGTATSGDEMTGTDYITLIKKFLSVTEKNFISKEITSMALKISFTKVTLTTEEITSVTTVKTSIEELAVKITAQIALVQETFKDLSGSEATDEEIKNAGSEPAEPKGLNTGAPEISATDSAIMKMKALTENKGSCEKVKAFLTTAISGSSTSSSGESIDGITLIKRVSVLLAELSMSLESEAISSLALSITEVSVTLSSTEITEVTTLKTSVESVIEEISVSISSLQFQLFSDTGSTASSLQITAGSSEATKSSAADAILADLSVATLNKGAIEAVIADLDKALAGTATSGSNELTGEAYEAAVSSFLMMVEMNLLDETILTQSYSLTSVKVTLTETQITKLKVIKTSFTAVVTKITTMISVIQASFKEITGADATSIQISAGSSEVTDAKAASSTFMEALKALTVNKGSIEKVETALASAIAGSLDAGKEVDGTKYMEMLTAFFLLLEEDYSSAAITAMSFDITNVKVTLTETQITEVKEFQTTIKLVIVKIQVAISFFQSQVKALTGAEATETQILAGDASATVASIKEENIMQLETMSINKKSVETVKSLVDSIMKDAVTATASGTTEMSGKEFLKLLKMFFKAIKGDFLSEKVTKLSSQISSAKLSSSLTEIEKTDIEFISMELEILIVDIEVTIQVIQYQLVIMTGSAPMIDVDAAIDNAVEDAILMLKIISKNTKACQSVEMKLTEAIGGTATSGTEIGSATFVSTVESFIKLLTADLTDITVVTQSTSITTAKVTLTTAEVTTVTTLKTSLTEIIVKLKEKTEELQEKIKSLVSTTANPAQIASGSATGNKDTAVMETLEELKALKLTSAAVMKVSETITAVIAGTATSGTDITGANFIILVQEFLSVTKSSFISVKITALALTIATSKVTLTVEEQTTIKTVQTEINGLSAKIKAQIAITQEAFKELTGKEATDEEIDNAGSEIAPPAQGVNTGRPEISATDSAIMKMKSLTENKGACEKVKVFLETAIAGTATSEAGEKIEGSVFVIRVAKFLAELTFSLFSATIMTLALTITSVSVTLTESQVTEVTALKTSVEEMITKIESEVSALQFQLFTETGSTASSLQITAGSSNATKESASDALLADLKVTTLNKAAIESVLENIKLVVAGTATVGTIEMTAEEYMKMVAMFLQLIEVNLMDASIVSQSFALSNAKVTLSAAEITKLEVIQKSFTLVVTKITIIISTIQTSFKELTGAEATSIQINSGSSSVTDAKEASTALIMSLKAITVNKGAIEKVETAIADAIAGKLSGTEEIDGAAFLLLLEEFFAIVDMDIESSAITAMSFKIVNAKVTLTSEQLTTLTTLQKTIKIVIIKITIAIEFFQSQIKTVTGSTATNDQILSGGSSVSISMVTEEIIVLLKAMTMNIASLKKIDTLLEKISKGAVTATASGSMEKTSVEFFKMVVKLFNMIAGNFVINDVEKTVEDILAVKLTVELTDVEKTDVDFIMSKMDILIKEIMTSIEVLQFQLVVMTGTTANIEAPGGETEKPILMTGGSPMTTKRPGMTMTTGGSGMTTGKAMMKSKVVRQLLKSSLRKYLD